MRHKLISSIISLVFLIFVSLFSGVFRYLFAAFAIFALAVMAYNYWYLKKHNFFTVWNWVRPLLFFIAILGIYFVVPNGFWKGLFLLISVALVYLVENFLLLASEQKIFFETLFSMFGITLFIFANNFYFLPKNSVTLLLIFIAAFLISRSSFEFIPQSSNQKYFFSLLIAFCLLEVSWPIAFFPINYTILAIITFNIFYTLWIIIYYYLFHNLSSKKISFHIFFSILIIILAFISTPWR
jgi:hypothetical protein